MSLVFLSTEQLKNEFNRQVQNLIDKNYLSMSELTEAEFLKQVNVLLGAVQELKVTPADLNKGYLPFVLVSQNLIDSKRMVNAVIYNNKNGVEVMRPRETHDFQNISSEIIPTTNFYLICDIYRGEEYLNISPEKALVDIKLNQNTPLTLNEGIAIVTHFPEFLQKNKCFSLPGSRFMGDQRVPAIWINAKKKRTWVGAGIEIRILGLALVIVSIDCDKLL